MVAVRKSYHRLAKMQAGDSHSRLQLLQMRALRNVDVVTCGKLGSHTRVVCLNPMGQRLQSWYDPGKESSSPL